MGSIHLDSEERERRNAIMESNFIKLDNFRTGTLVPIVNRIEDRIEDMKDIHREFLKKFQEEDGYYREKIIAAHETHFGDAGASRWDAIRRGISSFVSSFLETARRVFLVVATVKLLLSVKVIGPIVLIAGVVYLVTTPEEDVPDWLERHREAVDGSIALGGMAAEGVRDIAQYGPVVVVDAVRQGAADVVQTPEAIGGFAGRVAGSAAGGYVGVKLGAKAGSSISPQFEFPDGSGFGSWNINLESGGATVGELSSWIDAIPVPSITGIGVPVPAVSGVGATAAGVATDVAIAAEGSGSGGRPNEVSYSSDDWGDGNRGSPENNAQHHFNKHGNEVGASNLQEYLRKASAFRDSVLQKRVPPNGPKSGPTPNVYRYNFNGKYIDLQHIMGVDALGLPVIKEFRIISFGTQ